MTFETTDLMSLDTHTVDPHPFYRWLLENEPLYWDAKNELWAVSRYEDVVYVSKNTDLFCSGKGVIPKLGLEHWPDEAMINMDGDAHTCQRGLVSSGFTPRRISKQEERALAITTELIDAIQSKGKGDLVMDLARPLPFRIIADMLGYPKDKIEQVLDWSDIYMQGGCGPDHVTNEVMMAFAQYTSFHAELLEEKKKCPGEDLLTIWLNAELDGKKLSEDKLVYEHNLLLIGGSETTRSAISGGLVELMRNPEQMSWLQDHLDDEKAMSNAVEEIIRYTCPFVRMRRTATQDVELHGKTIKEGDEIIMLYPAANRDPRAYDRPDEFDVRRKAERPTLSFGYGKHFCIGASLARLETRVAVSEVLRRLPDIRLEPGTEPTKASSCFVRSLTSVPIVCTPVNDAKERPAPLQQQEV